MFLVDAFVSCTLTSVTSHGESIICNGLFKFWVQILPIQPTPASQWILLDDLPQHLTFRMAPISVDKHSNILMLLNSWGQMFLSRKSREDLGGFSDLLQNYKFQRLK